MGAVVTTQNRFVDLNLNFTINPQTGDISKRTNIEAIKASVRNLVMTNHYEKPFHPEIGTPINRMLFENASPLVGAMIEKMVSQVIEQHEPRAILKSVIVTMNDDSNSANITVAFQPTTTNSVVNFSIVVDRVR